MRINKIKVSFNPHKDMDKKLSRNIKLSSILEEITLEFNSLDDYIKYEDFIKGEKILLGKFFYKYKATVIEKIEKNFLVLSIILDEYTEQIESEDDIFLYH
jgi:hypothetical protein